MFSTLQICKILHLCKYKKWRDFSLHKSNSPHLQYNHSNHSNNSKRGKQFKQDSCVFSYYILKCYILLNLDIYFKHILDSKMKFIQTEHSFNKLIEIFDASRNNIILESIINSILKGLRDKSISKSISKSIHTKITKKMENTKNIHKTLRMTCLESNLFSDNAI